MDERHHQDQRYQIVLSLHKIEKLLKDLPDTIANAVDKALTEAFEKDFSQDGEDQDAS